MAKALYNVEGTLINDSWYIKHDGRYYAYYLQYPMVPPIDANPGAQWNEQTIGLSVSENLTDWEYKGTVLEPKNNFWCNKGMATGSIVKKDGIGYMLYTGNSWSSDGGFGLVTTKDFINFEHYGDSPVISRKNPYSFPYKGGYLLCNLLADPYIYPEPIDGWYYVFINSQAVGRQVGRRGCIAVMRSQDLINYEPYSIAMLSDDNDRLETPQVWHQSGKWFMYYGGVYVQQEGNVTKQLGSKNKLVISNSMTEDYNESDSLIMELPDNKQFYIGKVLEISEKGALFLVNHNTRYGYGPYWINIINDQIKITD